MIEIRFHGRGGQGTVIASILLSKALFQAGYQVQSFPVFGVERRGAPVEAYVRLDKEPILLRTNVYQPDHVVVQDHTLLQSVDVTRGLKAGGWVVINSPELPANMVPFTGFRLAYVDASRIALRNKLGTRTHPIVNTPMLGAVSRVFEMPPMDAIAAAIREEVPRETERNLKAAQDAYDEVRRVGLIEHNGAS
ncbi:MAG: 2-oxoacid:acceptor oxidoreductase family protein [Deltaproteobacteria bacterium]|nr:2-oxoacid:acceptor oxidoreductase family protein [Deltaproteobacteria bacterium]MBN2688666.1 2-oxoacid:acceptor oxidoreductase family protein [Deltaproteobacteria bacterium]